MDFPGGSDSKRPGFDPWVGKSMATHSIFLPGESPRTEKPGRVQSMRLQRIGHD